MFIFISCNFTKFISSDSFCGVFVLFLFLVELLGFSIYKKILSANTDNFTSSFSVWMPCISSYLIALVTTIQYSVEKKWQEWAHLSCF